MYEVPGRLWNKGITVECCRWRGGAKRRAARQAGCGNLSAREKGARMGAIAIRSNIYCPRRCRRRSRRIKEAAYVRRPSAQDSLRGQRAAQTTIAEAQAETSEQTGMERKPGTVIGMGMMGRGRRCRCRRRRVLMRGHTVDDTVGPI